MRRTVLAKRYAGALFRAAHEADIVDTVESDLGLIAYSLETIPQLGEVLAQPLIPRQRKQEIVREIFGVRVQDVTLRFLDLVILKRREHILRDVEPEYVKLANEHRGLIPVVVTSAVPLTEHEGSALRAKLESFTGKKVEMRLEEDADLIGGLVVRIGDTVIDGSVKGYLASLREQLLG